MVPSDALNTKSSRQPPAQNGQCLIVSDRTVAHNLCDSICMVNKMRPRPTPRDRPTIRRFDRKVALFPSPRKREDRGEGPYPVSDFFRSRSRFCSGVLIGELCITSADTFGAEAES